MNLQALTAEHVRNILELAGLSSQEVKLITPEDAQTILSTELVGEPPADVLERHQLNHELLELLAEAGTGVKGILPEALHEDAAIYAFDATPECDESVRVLVQLIGEGDIMSSVYGKDIGPLCGVDIGPGYVELEDTLLVEDASKLVRYFVQHGLITPEQALDAYDLYVARLEGHLYDAAYMLTEEPLPPVSYLNTRDTLHALVVRTESDAEEYEDYVKPGSRVVLRDGTTQVLIAEGLELNTTDPVFDGMVATIGRVYANPEYNALRFYVELTMKALVGSQRIHMFLKRTDFDVITMEDTVDTPASRELYSITPDELEQCLEVAGVDVPFMLSPEACPRLWDHSAEKTQDILLNCAMRMEHTGARRCSVVDIWQQIMTPYGEIPTSLHPAFAAHVDLSQPAGSDATILLPLQQAFADEGASGSQPPSDTSEASYYFLCKDGLFTANGRAVGDPDEVVDYLTQQGLI